MATRNSRGRFTRGGRRHGSALVNSPAFERALKANHEAQADYDASVAAYRAGRLDRAGMLAAQKKMKVANKAFDKAIVAEQVRVRPDAVALPVVKRS